MRDAGNQWNIKYEWQRDRLERLSIQQLEAIYNNLEHPVWEKMDDAGNSYQELFPETDKLLGLSSNS
jgi:hypothetical protein